MIRTPLAKAAIALTLGLLAASCSTRSSDPNLQFGELTSASSLEVDAPTDSGTDTTQSGTTVSEPGESTDSNTSTPASTDGLATSRNAETVDAWVQACVGGSDLGCDILFILVDLGSDAEELALTCGGRRDSSTEFCAAEVLGAESGLWFDESSPGLDPIEQGCMSGDPIACDFLYFRSQAGSRFERLGTTCGGRFQVAPTDCRSAMATQ